ncbi:UTP-hexose-1-phosphate uridylyltransferase [Pediococcus acidilactici NGRI 0510Q]|nr:UTP-hexose-1-phosphate uridylyltransferase [Pediococcus acidilactici NGRI 0510Q]
MADQLKETKSITPANVTEVVNTAVGNVFARVLADAGVFKWDEAGKAAFARFISAVKQ